MHYERCPICNADDMLYTSELDQSEDVRWGEWECDCGLRFYAESRVVDDDGHHDQVAEEAELASAFLKRRTCTMTMTRHVSIGRGDIPPLDEWECSRCGGVNYYPIVPDYCSVCGAMVVK